MTITEAIIANSVQYLGENQGSNSVTLAFPLSLYVRYLRDNLVLEGGVGPGMGEGMKAKPTTTVGKETPLAPARSPGDGIISLTGPRPSLDAEFKRNELTATFARAGLSFGRCFGSKSRYFEAHPKNLIVPNANVFAGRRGKVWWGDLDLTLDGPKLQEVARLLRTRLYVLREYDGRFKNAERPYGQVVKLAVWASNPMRGVK